MLKQSLEDSIKFLNKDMADAKMGLGKSAEKKSSAEGDLGVTLTLRSLRTCTTTV